MLSDDIIECSDGDCTQLVHLLCSTQAEYLECHVDVIPYRTRHVEVGCR